MTTQQNVAIGLGILLAGLGLVDLLLGVNYGSRETISSVVFEVSKEYPLLPFAAGMLVAHLFKF